VLQESPTPKSESMTVEPALSEFAGELAAVRSHLRLVDELDQQTADMVIRLADAVRSSTEVRAQVGLEIAASLERIERLLNDRRQRQRDAIAALRDDVLQTQARAVELAMAVRGLEQEMTSLDNRLSEASAEPAAHTEELLPAAVSDQANEAGGDTGETAHESSTPTLIDTPPVVPQPAATSVVIAVEQVPSATVALSIQRFVAGLPGVVAATTREFAAGQLRLEVMSRGAIRVDEIGLWPGGRLVVVEQAENGISFRVVA
jgi:hypothetical protein